MLIRVKDKPQPEPFSAAAAPRGDSFAADMAEPSVAPEKLPQSLLQRFSKQRPAEPAAPAQARDAERLLQQPASAESKEDDLPPDLSQKLAQSLLQRFSKQQPAAPAEPVTLGQEDPFVWTPIAEAPAVKASAEPAPEASAPEASAPEVSAPATKPSAVEQPMKSAPTGGKARQRSLPDGSVEVTLALIGDKWKVLVLRDLMEGTRRFGALRKTMPQVSAKVLTQQLRSMEANGLLTRQVFAEVPPRVEYSLTAMGRSLSPVLDAMQGWGDAYRREYP